MKSIKVSAEMFAKIKSKGDFDAMWEHICNFENKIAPYGLPRLAGGLDHYVINKKSIEIHDIGCSNGSSIRDNSFKIVSE